LLTNTSKAAGNRRTISQNQSSPFICIDSQLSPGHEIQWLKEEQMTDRVADQIPQCIAARDVSKFVCQQSMAICKAELFYEITWHQNERGMNPAVNGS
jgi:hypothetical protein